MGRELIILGLYMIFFISSFVQLNDREIVKSKMVAIYIVILLFLVLTPILYTNSILFALFVALILILPISIRYLIDYYNIFILEIRKEDKRRYVQKNKVIIGDIENTIVRKREFKEFLFNYVSLFLLFVVIASIVIKYLYA